MSWDDFMVKNNAKLLRKGLNYRQNLGRLLVKRKEK
jgi:hypothetical protein